MITCFILSHLNQFTFEKSNACYHNAHDCNVNAIITLPAVYVQMCICQSNHKSAFHMWSGSFFNVVNTTTNLKACFLTLFRARQYLFINYLRRLSLCVFMGSRHRCVPNNNGLGICLTKTCFMCIFLCCCDYDNILLQMKHYPRQRWLRLSWSWR